MERHEPFAGAAGNEPAQFLRFGNHLSSLWHTSNTVENFASGIVESDIVPRSIWPNFCDAIWHFGDGGRLRFRGPEPTPAYGDAAVRDRSRAARRHPALGNGVGPSQPSYPPGFLQGHDQVFADSTTAAGLGIKSDAAKTSFQELPIERVRVKLRLLG